MLPAIYDFWYQAFERGDSWAITCRVLNLFQYITFRAASAGLRRSIAEPSSGDTATTRGREFSFLRGATATMIKPPPQSKHLPEGPE